MLRCVEQFYAILNSKRSPLVLDGLGVSSQISTLGNEPVRSNKAVKCASQLKSKFMCQSDWKRTLAAWLYLSTVAHLLKLLGPTFLPWPNLQEDLPPAGLNSLPPSKAPLGCGKVPANVRQRPGQDSPRKNALYQMCWLSSALTKVTGDGSHIMFSSI